MPSVFVINHTGYSYSRAKEFGELVYLTRGYIDFNDSAELKTSLRSLIETATPEDYLLLSGNTLLCVIAVDLWKSIHKSCKILRWSRDSSNYIPYEL